MADDRFEPEIVSIVRQYSEIIAEEMPNDTLAQSLGVWERNKRKKENEKIEWQEWIRFNRPIRETESEMLERQCKEAAKTWEEFKKHFPELNTEGDSRVPTIEALQDQVIAAQQKWASEKEKGFGKAKEHTMSFLESLEAHKALFSVIPSGDKYTSLFTGVVSSVVKASVNYAHVAEGFSRALAEIGADLSFVQDSTTIVTSERMRYHIMELYVQVFKFLCEMMNWYQSMGKRFRSSFNNRFYDKTIDPRVKEIKLLVKQVEREASVHTQKLVQGTGQDVREVKTMMHDIKDYMHEVAEENRQHLQHHFDAKMGAFESLLQLTLGQNAAGLLSSNAQRMLSGPRDNNLSVQGRIALESYYSKIDVPEELPRRSPPPFLQLLSVPPSPMPIKSNESATQTYEETERYFESFKKYVDDNKQQVEEESKQYPNLGLPGEILTKVLDWLNPKETAQTTGAELESNPPPTAKQAPARVLWVGGTGERQFDQPLIYMAYRIYEGTLQHRLPAAAFFHRPRYRFQDAVRLSVWRAGMTALLCALIDQLIPLLPGDGFPAEPALARDSFARLAEGDGGGITASVALEILAALLRLAAPNLVVVVEGIEAIEHVKNLAELRELDRLLRTEGDTARRKILYVTSGASKFLNTSTRPAFERVDASRLAQGMRKRPIAGSMALRDVGI